MSSSSGRDGDAGGAAAANAAEVGAGAGASLSLSLIWTACLRCEELPVATVSDEDGRGPSEAAGHVARRGRKLRRCYEEVALACSAVDGGQLVEKDGMAGRQVAIACSDGAKDKRPAGFVFI